MGSFIQKSLTHEINLKPHANFKSRVLMFFLAYSVRLNPGLSSES